MAAAESTRWLEAQPELTDDELLNRLTALVNDHYRGKVEQVGAPLWAPFERSVMLQSLDTHWREHLSLLDQLRQGIHLRGYAQKNPKQEYKREAFELFASMLNVVRTDVVRTLITVRVESSEQMVAAEEELLQPAVRNVEYHHADYDEAIAAASDEAAGTPAVQVPLRNHGLKVGRNDPCPCGSGKKYKQCHGQLS